MYSSDEETAAARAGRCAHAVAERIIDEARRILVTGENFTPTFNDMYTLVGPEIDGETVTEDMIAGARLYSDDFLSTVKTLSVHDTPLHTAGEVALRCPRIHAESFGTLDRFLYAPARRTLILWEYKFGYIVVEPFENWQLINYFSGLLDLLDIVHDAELYVEFRVVQPRAYHRLGPVRTWCTTGGALRAYVNRLEHAATVALGPNPVAQSGPHCKYCPGRHACEAARVAGLQLYEAATLELPAELPPGALGTQLTIIRRALDQLRALDTAYSERVFAAIKTGAVVPGWCSKPAYGREAWSAQIENVLKLGELFNVDLSNPGVKTPAQAKKLGIPANIIAGYTTRENAGFKLEPENTNRIKEAFL